MSITVQGARHFPSDLLEGCEDALLLFAAGFYGRNDGAWVSEAGMSAVCVDTDCQKLNVMRRMYPEAWKFECTDAFAYAEQARAEGRTWDVVSADCPTNLIERCQAALPAWVLLARRLLTLTSDNSYLEVPGWHTSLRHRAGDVYWLVLERE